MSKTDVSKLIKVDLGPYASRLYKYDLFHDEEYRLESSKGLKFLHFNIGTQGYGQKTFSKNMFRIWQNRTVAVLALSPQGIRKIASEFLANNADTEYFIPMAVGVAFVSRDDNYSRQIGRDESVKQITEIDLKVLEVSTNQPHINVRLAPHQGVQLTLRLNKKSGFSNVVGIITGKEEDRK